MSDTSNSTCMHGVMTGPNIDGEECVACATFEQRLAAVQRRAEMGHIGADSIDMTDLVTVEVRGDYDATRCWTNEVVLTRERAGYAIWALAKSIGIDAEPMLKAAGVEGF